MKVTAAIVTFNSYDTIDQCIKSLQQQNITDIVVVDNKSQDKTTEVLRQKNINVIQSPENIGFAAGANMAGQQMSSDLILFLNPDCKLSDNLDQVVDLFENDPKLGIVGLSLKDSKGNVEPHSFGDDVTLSSLFKRKIKQKEIPKQLKQVDWVSGGAMVVRKKTFSELKGFDPEFFLYWEDVDLCKRARDLGWKVVYNPYVSVQHARGHSLQDKKRKTVMYDNSADRYFHKHYPAMIWKLQRLLRYTHRIFSPEVD